MKAAALCWLLVVATAAVHLAIHFHHGVPFQTDLMALLPQDERDEDVQHAKQRMAALFERRIVLLVGHADRATARRAGNALAEALRRSGVAESVVERADADAYRHVGEALFTHRAGLLAPGDRNRLLEGKGQEIITRALASIYSPLGGVDGNLLRHDPFLLLPAFLGELPRPASRVVVDNGMLTVSAGDMTYVMIAAQLSGNALALAAQDRLVAVLDDVERRLRAAAPDLDVLRSGAVFYAHAGAKTALAETSSIGLLSSFGIVLLVMAVFRALRPLFLTALAVVTGVVFALSVSLWVFRTLHVAAILFGVSLIGIAVDYGLHYTCERFNADGAGARDQLARVLPGISLGLTTTLIGYAALLLAPLPGLRQVAVFSATGLVAAFLTVVLWLPALDRARPMQRGGRLLAASGRLWAFWEEPRLRRARQMAIGLVLVGAVGGGATLTVDDDVRRLQALSDEVKHQDAEVRRLIGAGDGMQFFLVQGADTEAVLRIEETLVAHLEAAVRAGALGGFQAVAQVIPSMARQAENRILIQERLVAPFHASYFDTLGLAARAMPAQVDAAPLTLDVGVDSPLPILSGLVLEAGPSGARHLVRLENVVRPDALRSMAADLPGVRFIDPADDISRLFGVYRRHAVALLAISMTLATALLAWRYGPRGSLRVMLPPVTAVSLAPGLVALSGAPFTFFNAMALLLVFSIGIDYAIFCKESEARRKASTTLAVLLAALTTSLSFGLLALSSVYAVHAFGLTLTVGIALAFLLSPLAGIRPLGQ